MKTLVRLFIFVALVVSVAGCGKPVPKIGEVKINPKDGAEMVWVPAGEFIMGTYSGGNDDEKPRRTVYLNGYWMYKYEVTVAQYGQFCSETGRTMPETPSWGWNDNQPIVNVVWQDAAEYAKWAGASLPTEAQWEKAARGTDGREYPWGNEWDPSRCVNFENVGSGRAKPVGSKPTGASPYGCMDMAGNVWEWCADWYDKDYYKNAPARNPIGPANGSRRVLRGGGWVNTGYHYRCAYRGSYHPSNYISYSGFRLVR